MINVKNPTRKSTEKLNKLSLYLSGLSDVIVKNNHITQQDLIVLVSSVQKTTKQLLKKSTKNAPFLAYIHVFFKDSL